MASTRSPVELSANPRCDYSAQPLYFLCLVTLSSSAPPHTDKTCWTFPSMRGFLTLPGLRHSRPGHPRLWKFTSPCPASDSLVPEHPYPTWKPSSPCLGCSIPHRVSFQYNTLLTLPRFLSPTSGPLSSSSSRCQLLPSCSDSRHPVRYSLAHTVPLHSAWVVHLTQTCPVFGHLTSPPWALTPCVLRCSPHPIWALTSTQAFSTYWF